MGAVQELVERRARGDTFKEYSTTFDLSSAKFIPKVPSLPAKLPAGCVAVCRSLSPFLYPALSYHSFLPAGHEHPCAFQRHRVAPSCGAISLPAPPGKPVSGWLWIRAGGGA